MNRWLGEKVLILGAARQGLALARFLSKRGALPLVNDQRPAAQMQTALDTLAGDGIAHHFGGHPVELLDGVSLVAVSGGVPLNHPLILAAQQRGIPISNDSQIFMEETRGQLIGITGSAGKTTTTTLVGRMAQASVIPPQRAWVGGNIGNPLINVVDEIEDDDLVVIEFSSFQLELMERSPRIAAILNITPNHLDRHGTMAAYTEAKARLLAFQTGQDIAILNRDDPGSWNLAHQVHGQLMSFGFNRPPHNLPGTFAENGKIWFFNGQTDEELFPQNLIQLRGTHNLMNVLAACAIAKAAGMPVSAMIAGVDGFGGVAHRLEFIRQYKGAAWYNASISTAPERSAADIRSFEEPLVVLLGGRDKDLPWQDLAALVRQRVDHVVLFGEARNMIEKAIGPLVSGGRPFSLSSHATLQEAVTAAAEVCEAGDVVLLSPGGTSFDEFKDFEQRGERFREWVKALL